MEKENLERICKKYNTNEKLILSMKMITKNENISEDEFCEILSNFFENNNN